MSFDKLICEVVDLILMKNNTTIVFITLINDDASRILLDFICYFGYNNAEYLLQIVSLQRHPSLFILLCIFAQVGKGRSQIEVGKDDLVVWYNYRPEIDMKLGGFGSKVSICLIKWADTINRFN